MTSVLHLALVAADHLGDVLAAEVGVGGLGEAAEDRRLGAEVGLGRRVGDGGGRVVVDDPGLALEGERADHQVHRQLLVVAPEGAEDLGVAVRLRVPDEAEPGRVVLVEVDLLGAGGVDDLLAVPAQAEVDGEVGADRPAVLGVDGGVFVLRRGEQGRDRGVVDGRRGGGPVEVAVDRLVEGAEEDVHPLAAGHPLDDVGALLLVVEPELDRVVAGEAGGRAAVEVALEALLLDQPEAAGLEEVARHVAVLDGVAGAARRPHRVLLLVAGDLGGDRPRRVEDPLVAQGVVVAAELLRSEVGERVAVELVLVVVDRPGVVAGVLEERADQRLVLRQVESELGGAEIAVALRFHHLAGLGAGGELAAQGVGDPVVGGEKPEAVLDQVAADVGAVVLLGEALDGAAGGHHRLGRRLQRVVVVVAEGVAAELVAARLGDDVDDAAGGLAVLGLVAAGLDVDLLDELEVQLLALEAVLGAGGVDAVDVVDVLGAGGAVDGDGGLAAVVGVGVGGDPGRHLHHRGVVAAAGQVLDVAAGEVGAQGGRGGVHRRRLVRDGDLLGRLRHAGPG